MEFDFSGLRQFITNEIVEYKGAEEAKPVHEFGPDRELMKKKNEEPEGEDKPIPPEEIEAYMEDKMKEMFERIQKDMGSKPDPSFVNSVAYDAEKQLVYFSLKNSPLLYIYSEAEEVLIGNPRIYNNSAFPRNINDRKGLPEGPACARRRRRRAAQKAGQHFANQGVRGARPSGGVGRQALLLQLGRGGQRPHADRVRQGPSMLATRFHELGPAAKGFAGFLQ